MTNKRKDTKVEMADGGQVQVNPSKSLKEPLTGLIQLREQSPIGRLLLRQGEWTIGNLLMFMTIGSSVFLLLRYGDPNWKEDLEKWGKSLDGMESPAGKMLKVTKDMLERDIRLQERISEILLLALIMALCHFLVLVFNWKSKWTRSSLLYIVYLAMGVALVACSLTSLGISPVKMELQLENNCHSNAQRKVENRQVDFVITGEEIYDDVVFIRQKPYEFVEKDIQRIENCRVDLDASFIPTGSLMSGLVLLLVVAIYYTTANGLSLMVSSSSDDFDPIERLQKPAYLSRTNTLSVSIPPKLIEGIVPTHKEPLTV